MRTLVLVSLLAAAASANAGTSTVYYVNLLNNAPNSIVALGVAPSGSERFVSALPGNAPLPGNGRESTVAIRGGDAGCLRDLRVVYADGRTETHRDIDICRSLRKG
jgi:hypothetical protein